MDFMPNKKSGSDIKELNSFSIHSLSVDPILTKCSSNLFVQKRHLFSPLFCQFWILSYLVTLSIWMSSTESFVNKNIHVSMVDTDCIVFTYNMINHFKFFSLISVIFWYSKDTLHIVNFDGNYAINSPHNIEAIILKYIQLHVFLYQIQTFHIIYNYLDDQYIEDKNVDCLREIFWFLY